MQESAAAIGIANQGETVVAWDAEDQAPDPQRHRLAGRAHRRRDRAD